MLNCEIGKLLSRYLQGIEEFKPYLGRDRVKFSVRNAPRKVRWAWHKAKLEELALDLDRTFGMLNIAMTTPSS